MASSIEQEINELMTNMIKTIEKSFKPKKICKNRLMTRLTYIEKAKNNYKNGKKPNISRIIKHFLDLNVSLASKIGVYKQI